MSLEQTQLNELEKLNGKVGQAWDLSHEVEELGFAVREDDETGDALIVLQGCSIGGEDVIVGKIICDEEKSRIEL